MNLIQGEKFTQMADNQKVFYRNTHEANAFLQHDQPDHPYILITHNSDGRVTDTPTREDHADTKLIGPNLVKWYAQNVDTMHPLVESIPIGLGNNRWYDKLQDKFIERMNNRGTFNNMLYINHSISTNPAEREQPYELFKDAIFSTVENGRYGVDFDHYLEMVNSHLFVISPQGNGIDTHRLWECLYLGTIPIEKRNRNNRFYNDLPISFVDDWAEVTMDFMKKEFMRIRNSNAFWNRQKLDFDYWKTKIFTHAFNL